MTIDLLFPPFVVQVSLNWFRQCKISLYCIDQGTDSANYTKKSVLTFISFADLTFN